jgi:nucleoside-diphosphate-sugar epimerase
MILEGKFKIIGSGNNIKSFCYIDNLVQGVLLAEKSEKSVGRIYFISDNENYTPNKIAQTIAIEGGVTLSKMHLPLLISTLSGYLLMVLEKIFGIYSISLYSIKTMTVDFGCDISRAKEELGYYPGISLQEGIKRTTQWCKEKGLYQK